MSRRLPDHLVPRPVLLWGLLVVLVVSSGCLAEGKPTRTDRVEEVEYLTHNTVNNVDSLASPTTLVPPKNLRAVTDIHVLGAQSLIVDRHYEPHLRLVDNESGRMLATFGDHGKGPHELSSPGSLAERRPGEGGPVLFDFGNQRFVFLSLEPPAAPEVASTLPIDMETTLLEPAAIGEGYVANLLSAQHGLVFLDGSGAPVRKIRTPPAFPRGDVPSVSAFLELNQSSVIARPRGDRFAVVYHHRNRIDFFEAESGYLWSVSGPGESIPLTR